MKLDRNINGNRRGKYALLKLRRLTEIEAWVYGYWPAGKGAKVHINIEVEYPDEVSHDD